MQAEHGERFIETFTDALGGAGMIGVESPREIRQEATSRGDVGAAIGPVQDGLRPRLLALRQVIEDVAQLVDLAALDERDGPEEIADGFPQGSRAIEDHQQTAVGSQVTALQVREQRLAERRVLRRAFPQAGCVFLPVGGDPQRHDQAVLPDVDAIEDKSDQVKPVE